MPKNPYEWIYERESQPLKTYVLDEVAKALAKAVEAFPPEIEEWERADLQRRFDALLAAHQGRPSTAVVRVALRLFRWDLEREYEEIDRYVKGGHWHAAGGLSPTEFELAQVLWQFWLDQTLAFAEYAQGKFRRAELLGLADRLQVRLVDAPPPPSELH